MLTEWTSNLKSNLDDPFIDLSLVHLEQKAEIEAFIASGVLPDPVSNDFVTEVNKVLEGLVKVTISSDDLVSSLGKGTPQSIEEIKVRFERLVAERTKGQNSDKVRIVIQ